MKTQNLFSAAVLLFALIFSACKDDDSPRTELISNGNVELGMNDPDSWSTKPQTNYGMTWTDEAAYSPNKSLKIANQLADSTDFAYWTQSVYDNIPNGSDVTLKVKIKGDLDGTGVSIAIRGDNGQEVKQFISTEHLSQITGTFDWTEYSITMEKVLDEVNVLKVYLVYLPNTTGEVYYDDISLSF